MPKQVSQPLEQVGVPLARPGCASSGAAELQSRGWEGWGLSYGCPAGMGPPGVRHQAQGEALVEVGAWQEPVDGCRRGATACP